MTPRPDNIVKVYYDDSVVFGIVIGTKMIQIKRRVPKKKDGRIVRDKRRRAIMIYETLMREIAILKIAEREYDIYDCDFFLPSKNVEFVLQ